MLSLVLVLLLVPNAEAQNKARSTDIYEQEADESTTKSVTGKVRVVREVSDEVEVFFEGDKITGAYTLPRGLQNYGTMLKALEASKKANGPAVTITADEDKRIKTVELKAASGYQTPTDPNKKIDIDAVLESVKKK
ncbi:hypothetical protein D3C87_1134430 [compost metagenome]